jgi:hypothetical protein
LTFNAFADNSGAEYIEGLFDTSKATNIGSMFTNCKNLTSVPQFNFVNVTTSGSVFSTSPGLSVATTSNLKITTNYSGSMFTKSALENIMSNLGSNNIPQTITITSNPGADTPLSKTATWTASSNVVTMANTVGVTAGSIITATTNMQTGYPFTAYANNKISVNSLMDANTLIRFGTVTTSNLTPNVYYYTSNVSGTGPYYYDISRTQGGATATFTAGTMVGGVSLQIKTVNTNANVVLNAYPSGANTGVTVSTRMLNTNLATFKGWTVSG